ncbi:MAG: hypothetical protein E7384_04120 [Ruminococcaceae bacterium]|nr:hypothetical protein [Oscillospiraceae bacterium]
MKNLKNGLAWKICAITGVCLIVAAMAWLVIWQSGIGSSVKKAEYYADTIRTLIPEPQGAVLTERRDNNMSTLSIDDTNFVGIIEMPRYESVLPVCADWGNLSDYPCRFSGSVYDRTMQVGGTSQKGQYDFYRDISVGDSVFFTDMEGNRYEYAVTDIKYENNADQNTLNRNDSALTLFIKNIYAFEYIIISCDVLN